ncbi:MAG: iron dicitrate transport regulator FecR, partial [Caulobacteraceae bacterium]|nr:iron dicitrate transport regulator FecR [Caulobacteraceae bacterium]
MTVSADPSRTAADRLTRAAARWFARARSGTMGKPDRAALHAWLAEDAVHGEAYLKIGDVWDAAEHVRADPQVLAMREKALSRYPAAFKPARPALAAVCAILIAAAGIALVGWIVGATTQPAFQVFRTGVGQTANIGLTDGSRLTLDTDTTIRTQIT